MLLHVTVLLVIPPYSLQTTVHLVYMVHLDVGFTDLARNVCELYFDKFFPEVS